MKETKGYRNKRDWEAKYENDSFIGPFFELTSSDDGWICPHCDKRIDPVEDDQWGTYTDVVHDGSEAEVACISCGKDFVLRADVTVKFHSRPVEDEETDEGYF